MFGKGAQSRILPGVSRTSRLADTSRWGDRDRFLQEQHADEPAGHPGSNPGDGARGAQPGRPISPGRPEEVVLPFVP
jgi:hypothetical protein